MSVDTTYIVNQFKLPHAVNVEVANVSDTLNVHVVDSVMLSSSDSMIDSMNHCVYGLQRVVEQIAQSGSGLPESLKAFVIPVVIMIVSIMVPLLFNIITRIGNKYQVDGFIRLFFDKYMVKIFGVLCLLCVVLVNIAFVIQSEHTIPIFYQYLCCILAILLIFSSGCVMCLATKFDSSRKLFEIIKKQEKVSQFELYTDLAIYAEKNQEVKLFEDIMNYYIEDARKKRQSSNTYTDEDYKKLYDIFALNSLEKNEAIDERLALIIYGLLDFESDHMLDDTMRTSIYQYILASLNNQRYVTIQSALRYFRAYYNHMSQRYQQDSQQTKYRDECQQIEVLYFAVLAVTITKGGIECIEDAINHNFDAGLLANRILPVTFGEILSKFISINKNLGLYKKYAPYLSPAWISGDVTAISRALDVLFAYLLVRLKNINYDSICKYEGITYLDAQTDLFRRLEYGLGELKHQYLHLSELNIVEDTYFQTMAEDIINANAEYFISQQKSTKYFDNFLNKNFPHNWLLERAIGVCTNSTFRHENHIMVPKWNDKEELSAFISDELYYHNHKVDVYSRLYERIINTTAEVYTKFKQEKYSIHKNKMQEELAKILGNDEYTLLYIGWCPKSPIMRYNIQKCYFDFCKKFPMETILAIKKSETPVIEIGEKPIKIILGDVHFPTEDNDKSYPTIDIELQPNIKIKYSNKSILKVIQIKEDKEEDTARQEVVQKENRAKRLLKSNEPSYREAIEFPMGKLDD